MHRGSLAVSLLAAVFLAAAPTAVAGDQECGVILPVTDRLASEFDLVSPSGTPTYVAEQIRSALAPLYGLQSPAAVDLRIRSDMLASQVEAGDPYRPASPERLTGDLAEARELLVAAREFCAP